MFLKSWEVLGTDKPIWKNKPEGFYSVEEMWLLLEVPGFKANDFIHVGYLLVNRLNQFFFTSVYQVVR